MKILLLAPQPFYQERGTPIAVNLLLRALSERGDEVDLLCYHEGAAVSYPRMRLFRIPNLPFIKNVGPGPSLKKLVCDAAFFFSALRLVLKRRYDLIHAVEEAVFVALIFKFFSGTPYLYDMDSSLAEQIVEKYPRLSFLSRTLGWFEGRAIKGAEAVIPVCNALSEIAARHALKRYVVLHDISLLETNGEKTTFPDVSLESAEGRGPIVMYIGNLETYQGIDLLLESFAIAKPHALEAQLVVIGGQAAAVDKYRQMARRLGISDCTHFLGPKPVDQLGAYMKRADVLVSPRLMGKNTPMKVYSYLDSGKAVLATDLPTHRQAMTPKEAWLAEAQPNAFAEGLVRLLHDPALRERLAGAAKALVSQKHSYSAFQKTLSGLYDELDRKVINGTPPR